MLSYVAKLTPKSRVPQYTLLAVTLLGPGTLLLEHSLQSPWQEKVAQEIGDAYSSSDRPSTNPSRVRLNDQPPVGSVDENDELLWLARCIYSETKRPIEQLYVGWVIRNRVESQYRGNTTYRDVVLDPYQFSAFNTANYTRSYYSSLQADSDHPGWQKALQIARYVMDAPPSNRPFSLLTRHFYSERSLKSSRAPQWSQQMQPIQMTEHQIDNSRFQFFTGVL